MEKITFGRTGLRVSPLGFGAAPIGLLKTDQDQVGAILNMLLDQGVNVIDTAASYQGSEAAIGATVAHRRNEYVLISKCGTRVPELGGEPFSAELVTGTVDRALRNLRTDVLDVMLLHSCDLVTLKKGDALGALVKARDAGKVRFAGYSGDNEAAAYAAGLADVAVIETSVNLVDQANLDAVLPLCRKNGVGVIAKRPIANAAWKELSAQPGFYQTYAQTYTERFGQMKLDARALGFEGVPAAVWPEIALRFTLSQPGVHTAIIGTTRPENARRNIEIASKGPLPAETVAAIREAFRKAEAASGGKWEGQT